MKCFIGIDLGSTTTKAVLMDEDKEVLGQGITNSRSNYDTAAAVSKQEAMISTRFTLMRRGFENVASAKDSMDDIMSSLERNFRLEQFREQLDDLRTTCKGFVTDDRFKANADATKAVLDKTFNQLNDEAAALFAPGAKRKSDFFRDIAGGSFMNIAEEEAKKADLSYDLLLNVYDKSIIKVENRPPAGDMNNKFT
ncbi:MAG TPA: BadF/BadG/BcrA/BcrD ATPase family protein, partial [Rhodospirillales bacterium]|nr:BadF/BadG/BcrA/BcrD ATPase family protein [Rhodospirillales bacterium]